MILLPLLTCYVKEINGMSYRSDYDIWAEGSKEAFQGVINI